MTDLRKPIVLDDSGNEKELDQKTQVLVGGGFVPTEVESGELWVLPNKRQAFAPFVPVVAGVMQLGGALKQG